MAHGVAAGLGGVCDIPHGLACAVMLPVTLKMNYDQCKIDFEFLNGLNGDGAARSATNLIDSIDELCDAFKIPKSLSELNVRRDQIPEIVKASRGNSMNGNPVLVDDNKLTEIIEKML